LRRTHPLRVTFCAVYEVSLRCSKISHTSGKYYVKI
jgi:hypothetical protein